MTNDASSRTVAFRIAAGALAMLFALTDALLLIVLTEPWYAKLLRLLAGGVFCWGMGAFALGVPGPFNWRRSKDSGN